MIRRLQAQHRAGENRQRDENPGRAFQLRNERGTKLPRDEQRQRQPEQRRRQQRAFVQRERADPVLPAAFADGRALDLVADKREVGADFGIARRQLSARRYAAMALPRWPDLNSALA